MNTKRAAKVRKPAPKRATSKSLTGGMAGATYRGQQFSYDEKWRSASIGNIMQLEQIKWLCEEGAKRYDMGPLLGYGMGYKSHWTERKRRIETWILEKK